jgi:hypothetical protein
MGARVRSGDGGRWLLAMALGCCVAGTAPSCTDTLASNYASVPAGTADDGSCSYTCATLGVAAWNGTASHANASRGGGVSFAASNCTQLLLNEATIGAAGSCCAANCCAECCGTLISVVAGGRHVVQGRARPLHTRVVLAQGRDRAAEPPDGSYRLPQLDRSVSAAAGGGGAYVALRRVKVKSQTASAAVPSFVFVHAGTLVLEQSFFEANSGYSSGVATMTGGGEVAVRRCYFKTNRGERDPSGGTASLVSLSATSAGAVAMPHGGRLVVEWSVFENNFGKASGALYVGPPSPSGGGGGGDGLSSTAVTSCLFRSNEVSGSGRGGAVAVVNQGPSASSQLRLQLSSFALNRAGGPPGGSGAVWQRGGTLTIDGCSFAPNTFYAVPYGQLLGVRDLSSWTVRGTTFSQYTPCGGDTLTPASASAPSCSVYTRASPALSCTAHPCAPGQSCALRHSSTHCTACAWPLVSTAGLSCGLCAPGTGPANRSALSSCAPCPNGTHSAFGVCQHCPPATTPAANRTTCVVCALDTVSVAGLLCERCLPGSQVRPIG